jgi:hypothetical protein
MTDKQHNNQNQKPDEESSSTSTGEPKVEQKLDEESSSTSTGEPKVEQKLDEESSSTSTGEPKAGGETSNKNSNDWTGIAKTEDKGYDKSEYKSQYGDKRLKQDKDKNWEELKQKSSVEKGEEDFLNNTKFSTFFTKSIYELRKLLENTKKRIARQEINEKSYEDQIKRLEDDKRETLESDRRHSIDNKIKRLEDELEDLRQEKLFPLFEDKENIEYAINEKDRNSDQEKSRDAKAEKVSVHVLFNDEDPIRNTVLYVATFFPKLNPQDFKRVVSLLLKDRITTICVKESSTTEEEQIKITEVYKQKKLTDIWQESFDSPDKYLSSCRLKVYRQNGLQTVDFYLPELREEFLKYFQEEQFVYLDEQLRRTQELNLLFDKSDKVADNAINIAVKIAVDYPHSHEERWLLEIFKKITQEDGQRTNLLLERLSRLIYRLQIDPDYSKSQSIAQSFLEPLIFPEYRLLAFLFIKDLIDKNLRSGWQGIQSAKQLFNWLRQLLDKEELEKNNEETTLKYEGIEADIYKLLLNLMWQSGLSSSLYDFLGILREWLPEQDTPPEKYSPSNKASLFLLFDYCQDITLKFPYEFYGNWPSFYPLFNSLSLDIDELASDNVNNKVNEKLDILVSWLFHSDPNGNLAIKYVVDIDPIEEIGFFLSEWHEILWGIDSEEQNQEGLDLFKRLLQRIILLSEEREQKKQKKAILFQQKQLIEYWTKLTERFLDKATNYEKEGDKQSKTRFMNKRKQVRQLKQEFKILQQEIKTDK